MEDYENKQLKYIYRCEEMLSGDKIVSPAYDMVDKSEYFIVRNRIETVTSHIMTPYPGTVLYDRLKAEERILTDDLSLYNTAHVVFEPKNMTKEELYKGYLWIYRKVYSFENILKRMPKTKKQIFPYLAFNVLYRKWGRLSDFFVKLLLIKESVTGDRNCQNI